MEKKDLLQFCRYYKGEKEIENPDPDIKTFCRIEKSWIELSTQKEQSNTLSDVLSEYLSIGMREFEQFDDTPLTLKALLFNRFMKYNERFDIDAFKKWYHDKYI